MLVARVGSGQGRPLLGGKKPAEVLSTLINSRYPIYGEATLQVSSENEATKETADKVLNALYNHLSQA